MKDKRTSKRVDFPTTVHFAPPAKGRHEHSSYVTDFSETGMGIRTKSALKPGAEVLLFVDYHYDVYEAKGEVVWIKKPRGPLAWFVKNKAGIKYRLADYRLVDLYRYMIDHPPLK